MRLQKYERGNNRRGLIICLCLVLSLVSLAVGCSQPASPSPAPAPTSAPAPKATPTPSPTPSPTASPTAKPSPTASPAALSFAGKTITTVVAVSAGGGADLTARLYAKYMGQYLPGKPTMVVQNMAGGEGIIGANFAYAAKPDGLTLLLGAGSVYMADVLRKPAVKFNSLTEMTAIVCIPPTGDVFFAKAGIVDKPENIGNAKGLIFGHTTGPPAYAFASIKEFVNIPTQKVVMAYGSGGDAMRAFLSGEVNMSVTTNAGWAEIKPYYDKKEITLLFQDGMLDASGQMVKHPTFPTEVPTAKELYEKINGKAPSGIAYDTYVALMGSLKGMDRTLLIPPGASDDVKKAFFAAAQSMVKDPAFIADANKLLSNPGDQWYSGETMDKLFKAKFGFTPEVRKWLTDLMSTKYGMVLN